MLNGQEQAIASRKKKTTSYRREFVTIETADKIKLDFRIANPLLRFGAFLIDYVILIIIFLLILFFMDLLNVSNRLGEMFNPEMTTAVIISFYYILIFLLRWGYYTAFEILFEGRTPGKMICRIRTIHYQGKFLDLSSIVLRNFARLVDQDLTFCFGAFICMLVNPEYRRIGDLLANTIVVRDEKIRSLEKAFSFDLREPVPVKPEHDGLILRRLSEHDLYVLRQFLNAQAAIPEPRRGELIIKMAETTRQKIQDGGAYTNALEYLTSVYTRHQHGDTVDQVH